MNYSLQCLQLFHLSTDSYFHGNAKENLAKQVCLLLLKWAVVMWQAYQSAMTRQSSWFTAFNTASLLTFQHSFTSLPVTRQFTAPLDNIKPYTVRITRWRWRCCYRIMLIVILLIRSDVYSVNLASHYFWILCIFVFLYLMHVYIIVAVLVLQSATNWQQRPLQKICGPMEAFPRLRKYNMT